MKRITSLLLTACILLTGLAGCTGSQEETKTVPLQKVTFMLDWYPNTNHTGIFAAKDLGYYEEEGLEVEIVQPSAGGNPQLIAAGRADFAISYQEEVTVARSQDIPVVALAAVIQHNTSGFASPFDKNIKTPRDFAGKTYGGWGSPAETAILKTLMSKYGADFDSLKIVNIGDADFFASMEKGIDFSWIFYGWTGIDAELKGMDLNYIELKNEDKAFDYYTPVIIASEAEIAKNPELVTKFIRATARGYDYAAKSPDDAAAILLKNAPELNKDLVVASQKYLAKEYQADAPRWGEMKSEVWKDYADFMFNNKLIEKNIDVNKAFTNQYLPKQEG